MYRLLAVIQKIHHSEEALSRARENGRGAMLELWKTRKPRSNGMSCYEKENLDEVSELTDEGDSKYEDNPHGITPQLREVGLFWLLLSNDTHKLYFCAETRSCAAIVYHCDERSLQDLPERGRRNCCCGGMFSLF